MRKLFQDNKREGWFWCFVGLAAVLFVAMPLMSRSAGNSGDEDKFQIPQGQFVMNYYRTDKQDTTCLQDVVMLNGKEQSWNLKYYGCSFDVVCAWLDETLGVGDIARTRHACNALMGWLIVFFGGLIAYRAASVDDDRKRGWRAGVLTMLLLFLSPRLLGHSFNNPKDIPLAAGVIMSVYYIMMFFRQITPVSVSPASEAKGKKTAPAVVWPVPVFGDKAMRIAGIVLLVVSAVVLFATAGVGIALVVLLLEALALFGFKGTPRFNPLTLLMLALSIAIAVSNRIGGLIVVGYMGLWGLLWLLSNRRGLDGKTVGKAVVVAVATCATGFFAGLLLWPYAMQNPIHNSIESFKLMSQFDVQLRQLFEGQMLMSNALPWYYTPKFMLMTIPVAVLLGWVLYPFFGAFRKKQWVDSTMIYFTFLFPVVWIVITGANVYGGWRHSLFAYAPMAVAAGLGFDALAAWSGRKSGKGVVEWIVAAVPLLLLVPPAVHIVRNHPHEYVYFNELSGGVKKAFGHYELDYYYHSMRAATEWVKANAEPKADGSPTLVGSWHIESTKYFLRNDTADFQVRFVRWAQRGEYDWDYLVFPITGISGQYLHGGHFPPADCVHTVDVDGVPIALVLKRQNRYALDGVRLLNEQGDVDSALVMLRKALETNPYDETALSYMANICLQTGNPDSTVVLSQRLLEADPGNAQAEQMLVYGLLQSGQTAEAEQMLATMRLDGGSAFAYSLAAQLAAQRGDLGSAMTLINDMLAHGLMDNESLNLYVQISQQQGFNPGTAQYNYYAAYANGLEKQGDKRNAEQVRKQINGR